MKGYIRERVLDVANYIIETECTVRVAAKKFCMSKSTVHKDITERLASIDSQKYVKVYEILQNNKAERHLRGGMATKMKYLKERTGGENYELLARAANKKRTR